MKILLIILLAISITSCATRVVNRPVEVLVPVIVQPEFDLPDRPDLYIHDIPSGAISNNNYEIIVKSYVVTIEQLLTYTNQLELLLDGLAKPSR